jgi:hemerythrin superfamily protein
MATSNKESAGRKSRGTKGKTSALTLLEADHLIVAGLFEEYETSKDDEALKTEFAKQICRALTIHGTIEEEIFYPAAAEALEDDEEMEEAIDQAETDHGSIDDLVAEIEEALGNGEVDDALDDRLKGLGELVQQHVEEEEAALFPAVKKAGLDLDELGEELRQRKEELQAELGDD